LSPLRYERFDLLDYPASDPYFITNSARQGLIGLRYDISAVAGLKFELRRYRTDAEGNENQAAAQFAVAF
jgi:hypothetical protein